MEQVFIPVFVLILLLSAVVGFVVYRLYRKSRGRVVNFATGLGLDDMKSGMTYEAALDDLKYFYEFFTGSKNNPSYFKIWIDCRSRGGFRIGKETAFDRFFKNLGIAHEIQTGDSQFDRDYYINTDTVAFTRACFNFPERRQAVNELFNLNFKEILHDGKRLEVKISPFRFKENFDKATVESTVKQLVMLSRDLPEDYYEPRVIGTPAWKFKRGIIYVVSTTTLVAGFGCLLLGNIRYPPLDKFLIFKDSLNHSIPAFIIFIAVSIVFLKGRSSSHKDLLFNLCMALIGIPLTGYSGTVVCNGYLDHSPTNHHEVTVTGKRYTTSKNSKTYYLKLKSWRENRSQEEITVGKSAYDKAASGDTIVRVTTRPGYLGYEWLVDYAIVIEDQR